MITGTASVDMVALVNLFDMSSYSFVNGFFLKNPRELGDELAWPI